MAQQSKPSANLPTISRITLTQLIAALQALNVDVISPAQELAEEEAAVSGGPDNSPKPDPDGERILAPKARLQGQSPWAPPAPPVSIPIANIGTSVGPAAGPNPSVMNPAAAAAAIAAPTSVPFQLLQSVSAGKAPATIQGSPVSSGSGSSGSGSRSSGTVNNDNVKGYVCAACSHYNVVHSSAEVWYAVTAGRAVGTFRGWHHVQPLVTGVPHACYKHYSSEAAATAAFEEALAAGRVLILA